MEYTVKICIARCPYLQDYFLRKYGNLETGILCLSQNHFIHRQLRLLLKKEEEYFTNYKTDYIEMHLPRSDYIDYRSYNKLSKNGEDIICKELKAEFWVDFDKYIITEEALRMGPKMTVINFIEENGLEIDTYDMLIKHQQRFFIKLQKSKAKKCPKSS